MSGCSTCPRALSPGWSAGLTVLVVVIGLVLDHVLRGTARLLFWGIVLVLLGSTLTLAWQGHRRR